MSTTGKTALVIAERDGDWSGWLEPLREHSDDVVVLVQRRGESASELATRVRERVQDMRNLAAAALVGGPSWSDAILSARALMVRAIVTPMVAAGAGRLFLDSGTSPGRGRHAMAALASVVEDQVAKTGVDVVTLAGLPAADPQGVDRRAA